MDPGPSELLTIPRLSVPVSRLNMEVCAEFEISDKALMGRQRTPRMALARQVAYWLLYTHGKSPISYAEIGNFFSRDHGTIIHGCRVVDARLRVSDPTLCLYLDHILTRLVPPLEYQI